MKKLIVLAALFVVACTDAPTAEHALKQAGYSDIQTGGYNFLACSEDDTFHTSFSAKGPTNVPVTGTVCSGWFKGSTIRLD